MIVERSSTDPGGLFPELLAFLDADFALPLYHLDLKLRPPLGIYDVSLSKVLDAFEDVLSEFEKLMIDRPFTDAQNEWSDQNLINKLLLLLYALNEHMDDCLNILRCFVPVPKDQTAKGYSNSYPAIKDCLNSVVSYRKHISTIVNHMKHEQARLRFLVMFNEEFIIPGYFVESSEALLYLDSDIYVDWEVLGPSSEIHGKHRDTAFSLARDLRYHFTNIYFVAQQVAEAATRLVNGNRKSRSTPNVDDNRISSVASRIEKLPMLFFPDEMEKEIPSVSIIKTSEAGYRLHLTFLDDRTILLPLPRDLVKKVWVKGDGVSRKWRLPYARFE